MLSRLSAANSHDRLIEEPDNRGPDKQGCTVLPKRQHWKKSYMNQMQSAKDLGVTIDKALNF